MKSATEDGKFDVSSVEKMTIMNKCNEVIKWLDDNRSARKEEFEDKQKEIESVCNPIVTKISDTNSSLLSWFRNWLYCRRSSSTTSLNVEVNLSLPYSSTSNSS